MEENIVDFSSSCSEVQTYSGEVCRAELTSLQTCFTGVAPSPPLSIPSNIDQQSSEINAMLLVNGLSFTNPSQECRDAVLPFLCLALFPLCDSNGNLHSIVREDCVALRDEICVEVWKAAIMFTGEERVLPICEELKNTSNACICKL